MHTLIHTGVRWIGLAGISICLINPATAAKDSAERAQAELRAASLVATCANCHGTNGQGVTGSAVPGLANLSAEYIATNMKWFKTGERPATLMHQLAKGYTDEQIELIATTIANTFGKQN
ncbi:c-type cytochrome [Limnobacter humi]|uniref:C-type cytochrome n=1 Tax=Limnobacter humi TaxID=1778671 RepID=A0ABT1WJU0_9BURK|nr:c-type cytochrome [Limnobacter humi]MCQ8897781.1 c-type cytochrome [Limnobacter humi]